TASRAGVDAGTGPADDLDGETRGGLVPEIPVIIEQDRSIKSRPHGHLRHRRVPGGGGEASRPASVDEAEGDSQLADGLNHFRPPLRYDPDGVPFEQADKEISGPSARIAVAHPGDLSLVTHQPVQQEMG